MSEGGPSTAAAANGNGASASEAPRVASAAEAQVWLLDEAFARWAPVRGGASAEQVAAARARAAGVTLFEALLEDGALSTAEVAAVLDAPLRPLACEGRCAERFELPAPLVDFAAQARCPRCDGALLALEGGATLAGGNGGPRLSGPREGARQVGPYTLRQRLGGGGMGNVYLAEGPGTAVGSQGGTVQVALKLLGAPVGDAEARRRFEREGRTVQRLDHPNVVRVLGSGVDEPTGRPYLVLELVKGWDLTALLEHHSGGRLAPAEVAFVLDRAAKALGAAHAEQVLHRDVNPSNVLVTPAGQVKLIDFGIALAADVSVRLTAKDAVLGTPAYMAPEAAAGEPWTAAGDRYGLGATAFFLLTGRAPFEGRDGRAVLEAVTQGSPPDLLALAPETPAPLAALVTALLSRDPAARPPLSEVEAVAGPLAEDVEGVDTRALAHVRFWLDLSDEQTIAGEGTLGRERSLAPREQFHHYLVEEELGRGGMGIVYRARHLGLKREVALKVLVAGTLASDDERRRFLREAEAAGALQHPNIVPILDAGEHDGTYFLTMEYVRGAPLNVHARGRGDLRDLLHLFCRVCDGVHHAHSRGVIHRDLKPDNIIVDEQGSPRILDFGIAKRLDQEEAEDSAAGALTTEGDILGTLRYMPPEQAAGRTHDVDVRSDVYALGSILYEIACGETPFRGGVRELLHQIHFEEPRPPSLNRTELPWELDAICLKALEKDRDERYQSALELKQDVERFLEGLPIRARRATLFYRASKWAARNRRKAVGVLATASLVALSLGGWVGTLLWNERSHRQQVLAGARLGWERFASHDYDEATEKFGAAADLARQGDLLQLDDDITDPLPPELAQKLVDHAHGVVWVTKERLQEWREEARAHRAFLKANAIIEKVEAVFAAGRLSEAGAELHIAQRAAPEHPALPALTRKVVDALVTEGTLWIEGQPGQTPEQRKEDLARATATLELAQRLDRERRDALDALSRVHQELGKLQELEQAALLAAKARMQAQALTAEGAALLEEDELHDARRAFEQALAFDGTSPEARDGLLAVERRLAEERQRKEQEERQHNVQRLLRAATDALKQGDLEQARVRYIQALAFDGSNADARDGLVQVYKLSERKARREEERKRERTVQALMVKAQDALELGRQQFQAEELPTTVRESYFSAMEALQQVKFVDPGHASATKLLQRAAGEFSLILLEQGYPELSQFILRIGGVDDAGRTAAELPRDPHLAVIEASRVNVQRAYGGVVRFQPTKAFDVLREWIKRLPQHRYQVLIEVRSQVVNRGAHPEVTAEGLWVRIVDLRTKTQRPPIQINFVGGPYQRRVSVDSQGRRLVGPFDMSIGLDAKTYVRQVEQAVYAVLAPPPEGAAEDD